MNDDFLTDWNLRKASSSPKNFKEAVPKIYTNFGGMDFNTVETFHRKAKIWQKFKSNNNNPSGQKSNL